MWYDMLRGRGGMRRERGEREGDRERERERERKREGGRERERGREGGKKRATYRFFVQAYPFPPFLDQSRNSLATSHYIHNIDLL